MSSIQPAVCPAFVSVRNHRGRTPTGHWHVCTAETGASLSCGPRKYSAGLLIGSPRPVMWRHVPEAAGPYKQQKGAGPTRTHFGRKTPAILAAAGNWLGGSSERAGKGNVRLHPLRHVSPDPSPPRMQCMEHHFRAPMDSPRRYA